MSLLDLSALDATPLQRDPFDFIVIPGFLRPEALPAVNRDYPAIEDPRNHDPETLSYGPAFGQLLGELSQPEFKRRMASKFGVDLKGSMATITVRRFCERSDGDIHTDHWSKLVTMLIYFNPEWPHRGGQLRLLRSATDLDDYAAEVLPAKGTLLAFRRTDHSFHGHAPFVGERRMLQLNWIRSNPVAKITQRLARLSTHTAKRVLNFATGSGART